MLDNVAKYFCTTHLLLSVMTQNTYVLHCYSGKCRRKVDDMLGGCVNPDCPQGSGASVDELETSTQFKISLALSDHTGTIYSCQLTNDTAQHMINSSVSIQTKLHTNETT